MDYPSDEDGGDKKMLDDIFSLVAYSDPKRSVHGHYLDPAGRVAVAEELNSAILGRFRLYSPISLCWMGTYLRAYSLTRKIILRGSRASIPAN